MNRNTILRIWLLALMSAWLLSGCGGGGDEAIETDPSEGMLESPAEDVEIVEMGEDPMAGAVIEEETPEPSDVIEPVVELDLVDVFFDFNQFELREDAFEALAGNGRLLRENSTAKILIEGHCDERGTAQYNLALGEKRAQQVRDYLANLGIAASRIQIVSYGKEKPFAVGHDEESWALNRRVHFVLQQTR